MVKMLDAHVANVRVPYCCSAHLARGGCAGGCYAVIGWTHWAACVLSYNHITHPTRVRVCRHPRRMCIERHPRYERKCMHVHARTRRLRSLYHPRHERRRVLIHACLWRVRWPQWRQPQRWVVVSTRSPPRIMVTPGGGHRCPDDDFSRNFELGWVGGMVSRNPVLENLRICLGSPRGRLTGGQCPLCVWVKTVWSLPKVRDWGSR